MREPERIWLTWNKRSPQLAAFAYLMAAHIIGAFDRMLAYGYPIYWGNSGHWPVRALNNRVANVPFATLAIAQ